LKKKKKKTKESLLTFRPSQPAGPPAPPRAGPRHLSLFLFFALADDWVPPVSFLPSPFLSSSSLLRRPAAAAAIPAVSLSFPLLLEQAN
jgi:hypothetical protein